MPRKQDPKIAQAKIMFKNGKKLIEISQALGIPEGTVRSWKNRYKWDGNEERKDKEKIKDSKKSNATLQKQKEKKKCNVAKSKSHHKKTDTLAEVKDLMENDELTDKQKLFCIYMTRYFNATKAYKKAYGCSYSTAMCEGSKHLKKPKIQEEIKKIKQAKMNRMALEPNDIFQKFMDIAFSDITDYLTFGKKNISYTDRKGNKKDIEVSYVDLNESEEVDGTLISEVKQGKDGVGIKLSDRMKALAWLADHMDLATEEQKARVALLKSKVAQDDQEEETEDDGFIEALSGQVNNVWER